MKGGGGFLLLVLGAIGLIGFLSGQLDRWLAALFTPTGAATGTNLATGGLGTVAPTSTTVPSGDRRPGSPVIAGGLSA